MYNPILIADNDPDFLNTWAENLQLAGYNVFTASSPEEAIRLLKQKYVHMAIVDLRLRDDKDPGDKSGYEVLVDDSLASIPKIILTGFATVEDARKALVPRAGKGPMAIDLIIKQDGVGKMLNTVKDVLNNRIQVNWSLKINFDINSYLSIPGLVMILERNLPIEFLLERVNELEVLFRKIFSGCDQVMFSHLLWHREGVYSLIALTRKEGVEDAVILTCGLLSCQGIAHPPENSILANLQVNSSTILKEPQQVLHYYAETRELFGGDVNSLQNFVNCYHENSDKQLQTILDKLLETIYSTSGQQSRTIKEGKDLLNFLRDWTGFSKTELPSIELNSRLVFLTNEALRHEKIKMHLDDDNLTVKFFNGTSLSFPNPIPYLYRVIPFTKESCVFASSLGGLDLKSVLVSSGSQQVWLTDFTHVMEAPLSFDIATIETGIRFDLTNPVSLQDTLDDEKEILKCTHLSSIIRHKDLSSGNQRKGELINSLRQRAVQLVGDDLPGYIINLLFCSARQLAIFDQEHILNKSQRISLLYRFMFCAMLCEKIDQLIAETRTNEESIVEFPKLSLIEVDEKNGIVKVGERIANLSGTEYRFLRYLYWNAGKICGKQEIAREVLGNFASQNDANYINTLLVRVRDEIEDDTRSPKYILTIPRKGIQLMTQPVSPSPKTM